MNNNTLNCQGCNKHFKSIKSVEYHKKICIYYIYKKNNSKNIDNNLLNYITKLINTFDLPSQDINRKINKQKILNDIKLLYLLNHKDEFYLYIYNIIDNYLINELVYYDLLKIISEIYNIPIDDIINIIKCINISYNNLKYK